MLESSGLLNVRPPLPPARSGDSFYHAIPFQASCVQGHITSFDHVAHLIATAGTTNSSHTIGTWQHGTFACMRAVFELGALTKQPVPSQSGTSDDSHAITLQSPYSFQILSWAPRIVLYPAFIDPSRCDHIVAMANKMLTSSGLAYAPKEAVDKAQQIRTSKGTFLNADVSFLLL